ncbi:MAG: hypothetical protein HY666_01585 [Chloroflexi bacterium]|nr:hypothetical protein [Chloroflexota bacterium]
MKTVRFNFTIAEDLLVMLKASVGDRKRSNFISAAVREKLLQLEQEKLNQTLIMGYRARRNEDAKLSKDWEDSTLEGWL